MISGPPDPLHSLSPETRLLLGCNSTGVFPTTQLCTEIVNWQKLLRAANSYDLAPLLYLNLKMSVGSDLIPTSVSERLETIYKRSCVEVMNAFVKLEEILSTFSRAGIPAIVLKGAALTALVYRRMGLRPLSMFRIPSRRASRQSPAAARDCSRKSARPSSSGLTRRRW